MNEVRAGQQGERVLGLGGGDGAAAAAVGGAGRAGQGGDGVGVEVGTGVQADQPERPRGGGRQVTVGPGEHAADRGPLVAARVEQVKPPLLPRQLPREFGQAAVGAGGGQLGRHPQRQRQPRALGRQLGRRVGLGVDSVADQRPQQPDRVGDRQHVEGGPPRPVPRDQPGQRVPAGDHHQAGRAAGQQRAGLLDAGGVVEHHQHPAAVEQAAVRGGALVFPGRDVVSGQTERAQEPGQRVPRRDRRARVVAAQVHVELAVGERGRRPAGPAHRERGLAHPGGSRQHRDRHRGPVGKIRLAGHPGHADAARPPDAGRPAHPRCSVYPARPGHAGSAGRPGHRGRPRHPGGSGHAGHRGRPGEQQVERGQFGVPSR